MKASVGDRIVIPSAKLDGPVRDGRIVEVRHTDGTPPYLVEWSDSGHACLVFPGPDAHVVPSGEPATDVPLRVPEAEHLHVRRWHVDLDLFESAGETTAHAVLVTDSTVRLDSRGSAKRKAGDPDVPEIGDEVAVARALRNLSDRLLGVASEDITAIEGRAVSLPG